MARQIAKTLDQVEAELEQKDRPEDKRDAPKELTYERDPRGLYRIVYTAGGEVPDCLKGLWTSVNRVQALIENYKATAKQ